MRALVFIGTPIFVHFIGHHECNVKLTHLGVPINMTTWRAVMVVERRVVVVGAGMGGLAASIALAGRAIALGPDLGDDGARRKGFRSFATTCSFRATTEPNSTTSSGIRACRAARPSTSARRIAMRRRAPRSCMPRSASSASSTLRPVQRTAPSPMRRSSHARKSRSECSSDMA